jgi:threonyl-tRNA synthetase
MFVLKDNQKDLALKPMNCPAHIEIFKQGIKSYKDLPLRLAEFGMCYRNESSGALHGLMRVRQFVQDDAHIFCTEEQVKEETKTFCNLLLEVYSELGFTNVEVKFSDRPELRIGDDKVWAKAESALKDAIAETNLVYTLNSGEGAFYGPKIEFTLTDAIGRQWQCGTLQVDFMLPERLDATYIDSDGKKRNPVMLHRAILGTFERFIGILIEHYEGRFPLWLAPVQVCVINITEQAREYANEIYNLLKTEKIRVIIDTENKNLDFKIKVHSLNKIPIMWIVGQNEIKTKSVSIRNLGDKSTVVKPLLNAISDIKESLGGLK